MKQAILVRTDLKMSAGKIAAQVAHASLEAALKSKKVLAAWRREGAKKVILKVSSEKELLDYEKKSKKAKLVSALITDAGYTEIPKGSITALAIGPDKEEKINKVTGDLDAL